VALLIGASLAFAVGLMARAVGLDRDRAFYPSVMIVVASYYCLFAVMGASTLVLGLETLVAAAFIAAAIWGFKVSLWVVVVALAAHGVFDLTHGELIANPGVPRFWPDFCSTYDVVAAAFLAWLLKSRRLRAVT
jgi:hypothetical protein